MPIQDFDNDESDTATYNWGYMPVHFNSPDGGFATGPRGPAKIRELKTAIQALHERGIGVILDVVYNHTASGASFESLVPGYYFRMTGDGQFSNGSGCGNEFQTEWPMARDFILDSVKYWVEEYHVDGFRFDLMGLIDLDTMKRIREELSAIRPGILVYGEPWTGGVTPLSPITDRSRVRGTGIGAFNDHFRDAIKGDRDGGAPGFIQVGDRRDGIIKGLAGAIHDWAIDPVDAIQYFAAHDNLTAYDKLLQSVPDALPETKNRMMRFAHLILLTSQGVIFLHSGQEMCRTKQGNANSYNAPDAINQIDWNWKRRNRDVFDYVRGLIRLRKAHSVLRLRTRAEVERRVRFADSPTDRCIVYVLDGDGLDGERAKRVRVYLNGDAKPVRFSLPAGEWSMLADADRAGIEALETVANHVTLPPHSGVVLMQTD
jgi:pullulanase